MKFIWSPVTTGPGFPPLGIVTPSDWGLSGKLMLWQAPSTDIYLWKRTWSHRTWEVYLCIMTWSGLHKARNIIFLLDTSETWKLTQRKRDFLQKRANSVLRLPVFFTCSFFYLQEQSDLCKNPVESSIGWMELWSGNATIGILDF